MPTSLEEAALRYWDLSQLVRTHGQRSPETAEMLQGLRDDIGPHQKLLPRVIQLQNVHNAGKRVA